MVEMPEEVTPNLSPIGREYVAAELGLDGYLVSVSHHTSKFYLEILEPKIRACALSK
jgi:hypothetical protein